MHVKGILLCNILITNIFHPCR